MNTTDRKLASGFRRLFRLSRKELVEILRDRRTIITLVLMPLLVYPLLGILVQKFMVQTAVSQLDAPYRVGFVEEYQRKTFVELLRVGDQIVQSLDEQMGTAPNTNETTERNDDGSPDASQNLASSSPARPNNDIQEEILAAVNKENVVTVVIEEDKSRQAMEELVATGQLDLAVVVVRDQLGMAHFDINYSRNSQQGKSALDFVGRRLRLASEAGIRKFIGERVEGFQIPGAYITTHVPMETQAVSLLTFIPLMLVLMTITGAVYPAIDLTAGERERGTMEILVSAPISRMSLLFGKFVAVLGVAMLTAIVNLIAMTVTVYSLGLEKLVLGDNGISITTVLAILVLLFVLASFFSATLLALTSFARSFKEAQAYLIPLMLLSFAPGMISLSPNVELNHLTAIIPLINIVLAGQDLLAGTVNPPSFAIVIISTVIYGLLALSVAAKVFGADSVLTGGSTSWADMFQRSSAHQQQPTLPTSMLFLSVLFPGFIVVAGLMSRFDANISDRLMYNAGVTFGCFVLLPLLFTVLFNLVRRSTFNLVDPGWLPMVAATLLGISVWVFAYELEILTLTENRLTGLKDVFSKMKIELQNVPLEIKLFCLAIVPAVCEEFTFRGFLLSAFREKMSFWATVVSTALLFGMFHVFVRDALMFERMIPSTMMGLLLGFICMRTGSLYPGILLHVLHNGLLITLAHNENQLKELGFGLENQKHLPLTWILLALVPAIVGLLILIFSRRNRRGEIKPPSPEKSAITS